MIDRSRPAEPMSQVPPSIPSPSAPITPPKGRMMKVGETRSGSKPMHDAGGGAGPRKATPSAPSPGSSKLRVVVLPHTKPQNAAITVIQARTGIGVVYRFRPKRRMTSPDIINLAWVLNAIQSLFLLLRVLFEVQSRPSSVSAAASSSSSSVAASALPSTTASLFGEKHPNLHEVSAYDVSFQEVLTAIGYPFLSCLSNLVCVIEIMEKVLLVPGDCPKPDRVFLPSGSVVHCFYFDFFVTRSPSSSVVVPTPRSGRQSSVDPNKADDDENDDHRVGEKSYRDEASAATSRSSIASQSSPFPGFGQSDNDVPTATEDPLQKAMTMKGPKAVVNSVNYQRAHSIDDSHVALVHVVKDMTSFIEQSSDTEIGTAEHVLPMLVQWASSVLKDLARQANHITNTDRANDDDHHDEYVDSLVEASQGSAFTAIEDRWSLVTPNGRSSTEIVSVTANGPSTKPTTGLASIESHLQATLLRFLQEHKKLVGEEVLVQYETDVEEIFVQYYHAFRTLLDTINGFQTDVKAWTYRNDMNAALVETFAKRAMATCEWERQDWLQQSVPFFLPSISTVVIGEPEGINVLGAVSDERLPQGLIFSSDAPSFLPSPGDADDGEENGPGIAYQLPQREMHLETEGGSFMQQSGRGMIMSESYDRSRAKKHHHIEPTLPPVKREAQQGIPNYFGGELIAGYHHPINYEYGSRWLPNNFTDPMIRRAVKGFAETECALRATVQSQQYDLRRRYAEEWTKMLYQENIVLHRVIRALDVLRWCGDVMQAALGSLQPKKPFKQISTLGSPLGPEERWAKEVHEQHVELWDWWKMVMDKLNAMTNPSPATILYELRKIIIVWSSFDDSEERSANETRGGAATSAVPVAGTPNGRAAASSTERLTVKIRYLVTWVMEELVSLSLEETGECLDGHVKLDPYAAWRPKAGRASDHDGGVSMIPQVSDVALLLNIDDMDDNDRVHSDRQGTGAGDNESTTRTDRSKNYHRDTILRHWEEVDKEESKQDLEKTIKKVVAVIDRRLNDAMRKASTQGSHS